MKHDTVYCLLVYTRLQKGSACTNGAVGERLCEGERKMNPVSIHVVQTKCRRKEKERKKEKKRNDD